jgi:hypothetical protein
LYSPGKLIYFDPFYFKSGDESKPKYFLVLKVIGDNIILASLPSSKIHLPADQSFSHGCLEIPESCINCYIIKAKTPITKEGWSFELDTFLYGQWLDDFPLKVLQANYQIQGVDYEIIGDLTETELKNIIQCFAHSANVKRKYKKLLADGSSS